MSATTEELITRRESDLVDYQNKAYANKYAALINKVREAEAKLAGDSDEIIESAARYLYKLMACKDELEVARLYTNGTWQKQIEANFSGNYKIKFHMALPLISKRDPIMGHLKKREFGGWMLSALKMASMFKGMRNSSLNPFGYSQERKEDKEMLRQYEAVLNQIIDGLTEENKQAAKEMAQVPEFVRGYGHVRTQNIESAVRRWKTLGDHFKNPKKIIKVLMGATA